jgi:hypothetical protein
MACTDLTDKATFLVFYPGFNDPSFDAIIDAFLECLACKFCEDLWGCHLKLGSTHYLGHQMTMWLKTQGTGTGGTGGGAGEITAKSMGPVSVSFATTTGSEDGSLSETAAGREYMRLRDCLPTTGVAFGMGLGECC